MRNVAEAGVNQLQDSHLGQTRLLWVVACGTACSNFSTSQGRSVLRMPGKLIEEDSEMLALNSLDITSQIWLGGQVKNVRDLSPDH